jgi:hypothetical protein
MSNLIVTDDTYLHGRFVLQITNFQSKHLTMLVYGGFWVDKTSGRVDKHTLSNLPHSTLSLKTGNTDPVPLNLITIPPPPGEIVKPMSGSLFGDGPDFSANYRLEWVPCRVSSIAVTAAQLRNLVLGNSVFVTELKYHPMFYGPNQPRTFKDVTLLGPSRHQVVIAQPSLVLKVIETLKPQKTSMQLMESWVNKSQFDQFWTSMFGTHGNDTPFNTFLSVRKWISSPAFAQPSPQSPSWHVLMCFLLLGNPDIRNAGNTTIRY